MKYCLKCGQQIAKNAKVCPKCGYRYGLPGWAKALIILGVILLCIVGCVGACTKTIGDAINEVDKQYEDVSGKKDFYVGDTFNNKFLSVKFESSNPNFTNYSEYAEIKDGYKIVQYTFNAKNISDATKSIDYTEFKCYSGETKREQFYSVDGAGLDTSSSLAPGKTMSLSIYCEVEKDSKDNHVIYNPFLSDTFVNFYLDK